MNRRNFFSDPECDHEQTATNHCPALGGCTCGNGDVGCCGRSSHAERRWPMTQPTKREQLAAMRLEEFKAHLRMIAGEDPKAAITGAARPHPMLVRNRKTAARAPKKRRR
jgi:hypothetical protein